MVLLLAISVLVAFLSLVNIEAEDSVLLGKTFAPSLVAVVWVVVYLFTSYRIFGTLYLFASAYVVCLFVFHYGLLIQDGFGFIHIYRWEGPMGPWAVRAGWYANLALACLGIGIAAYGLANRMLKMPPQQTVNLIGRQNMVWLYDLGIGLSLASLLLLLGSFANYGNLLALTRLELFHLSDTRFISVFSMVSPSAATALVLGASTRRQRRWAFWAAAFVLVFFLMSGQRSSVLFPLLAAAIAWVKIGHRIPPMLAGIAVLITLLIIPVIGTLRSLGTYGDILNADSIEMAAESASISLALGEMGGSIGPLMYTLKIIPDEESYRYGSTYLSYLLDVLPNVGFTSDRSTSRAAVLEILRSQGKEKALQAMNVGDWASFHIIPEQFALGGGAGYSGVAEPYFNFGLVGVLLYFGLLGVFLGRLDSLPIFLYRNWLVFSVLVYWHLLPTVRNGFAVFSKPAVFTLIIVVTWLLVRRAFPTAGLRGRTKVEPQTSQAGDTRYDGSKDSDISAVKSQTWQSLGHR
jgi:oligosaccharide repeat unit polymerase